ncbi:MAG: HDOD domain-containing protein [Phycisphaerales bacterium]
MSTETTETSKVVASAIQKIGHIATLPEITLKIIELVEDPNATAQDLHKVVEYDPALCSRVLKVVNSSFYGLPGQIGSINRAIVLLGLNAVKNIAISASLAKLFRGGKLCPAFNAKDLWTHSTANAATSKLLADELGLSCPDEAFLAGLMHDIGIIVEMQADRDALTSTVSAVAGADGVPTRDMLELERENFGADHQQFGQALCEKWKFPRVFGLVAGSHHNPLEVDAEVRTLPLLVHVADKITAGFEEGGFRLDVQSTDVDDAVLEALKLTPDALTRIREVIPEHIEEVRALLS